MNFFYVTGSVHTLALFNPSNPMKWSLFIIPILQRGKLRHRVRLRNLPQDTVSGKDRIKPRHSECRAISSCSAPLSPLDNFSGF